MKSHKFVDKVTLHAESGRGGDGCVSFRREKFVPKGGPDGGDGGRGGHVILQGCKDTQSLISIFYAPHRRAEHGTHGKGKQLYGRNGKDLVVKVPLGTEIHDQETGLFLADITEDAQEFIIAEGGKGGLGNVHWKSATHQAPREHTDGEPGEEKSIFLTLKIIADVGLVGFPNAGKSSLLRKISDAHPKTGAYPFTTLHPVIGTVIFEDYSRLTVADIPGLIEGAHEGVGLGHEFLKHIERSSFLVYVIDMAGVDQRKPEDDFAQLQNELKLHKEELLDKPSVVVANKMDLPEAEENLKSFIKETGIKPLLISAEEATGIEDLKKHLLLYRKSR